MPIISLVIISASVLLAAAVAWRFGGAWWKFRGRRLVTCPENQKPAGVTVDAGHAAATALTEKPDLRLSSCSRWPEHAGCGQACLSQIEAAPEDCLVRNILAHWYQGKNCAWCHRPIGEIHAVEAQPALLTAGKVSMEWGEVPPDELMETLATAQPLCFACHIANKMKREHPELVIDRSRPF